MQIICIHKKRNIYTNLEETKTRIAKQDRLHVRFYYIFVAFFVLSIALLVYYLLDTFKHYSLWDKYLQVLVFMVLAYTWYVFILLFFSDYKSLDSAQIYKSEKIAVLIPCYNEKPELLERCVRSVHHALGNKLIILIDDGSTNDIRNTLDFLKERYGVIVHSYRVNRGKRHAMHYGGKVIRILNRSASRPIEAVVTIDSDTVIEKKALVKLVGALSNAAAVTGQIQVLNEKENLLARMIAAYYWTGLNIYRRAQSTLGIVSCCSGCLAAYRANAFLEVIDDFAAQTFMGNPCTYSEDRHLTNLILMRGHKVCFVADAVASTESPATFKAFLKQQLRWKRGAIRESALTLSFAWKTRKVLFLEIFLWDLGAIFYTLALRVVGIFVILSNPAYFVLIILPAWIGVTFLRNIMVLLHARDKIVGMLLFTVFHEFILYWQNLYALFTVTRPSWITRSAD